MIKILNFKLIKMFCLQSLQFTNYNHYIIQDTQAPKLKYWESADKLLYKKINLLLYYYNVSTIIDFRYRKDALNPHFLSLVLVKRRLIKDCQNQKRPSSISSFVVVNSRHKKLQQTSERSFIFTREKTRSNRLESDKEKRRNIIHDGFYVQHGT